MKKNILIIMVLVFSLLLISCSSTDGAVNEASENTNEVVENETQTNEGQATEDTANDSFLAKGKVVPDLEMYDLEGNLVKLSDHRGKIIMLNFWATWCTYCDLEMPDLETVNKDEDVVVLAVNVREPKALVEEYLEKGGYTFDVVLDESGDLADEFLITSFPTTFFISSEGTLLGSVPGMMELDRMNLILDDIRSGVIK